VGEVPEGIYGEDVVDPVGPVVVEGVLIHVAQLCADRSAEVDARADEGPIPVGS